jgi:hypothetical protein
LNCEKVSVYMGAKVPGFRGRSLFNLKRLLPR